MEIKDRKEADSKNSGHTVKNGRNLGGEDGAVGEPAVRNGIQSGADSGPKRPLSRRSADIRADR